MKIQGYSTTATVAGSAFIDAGASLTPLILYSQPVSGLEGVYKAYIDTILANIDTTYIKTGTLSVSRFPPFKGDIFKHIGLGDISLNKIHLANTISTKSTVNANGIITKAEKLLSADIPNLSWNKITTGKPTTLKGYGITDILSTNGGNLTGFINYTGSFTDNLQAVNKQYIDTGIDGITKLAIGDIVRKPYSVTPVGFLKCNGGLVSKTTYSNLYSVIQDRYNRTSDTGYGSPWLRQYNFNTTQDSDLGVWTEIIGSYLPVKLIYAMPVVTKNRMYLLGGEVAGLAVNTIYTAPINPDGTLGNFTLDANTLPGPLNRSKPIVTKNRVYLLTGYTGTVYGNFRYTCPINPDGTLGAWTADANTEFNSNIIHPIIIKNNVYCIYSYFVYKATINADGTLTTFTNTNNNIPIPYSGAPIFATKSKLYICGGWTGGANVYSSVINADGTLNTWIKEHDLPEPNGLNEVYVTNNRVYLIGGLVPPGYNKVYSAPIDAAGNVGTWTRGTDLPGSIFIPTVFSTKNHLYSLGYGGFSIYYVNINGGLNDYSPYYDGTLTQVTTPDPTTFALPDLTLTDKPGTSSYIKY